ncbi:MAG TPA: energy transducer TonB [Vicinamibacterales bacterium]|nr:energy transducer TonB [Vicinamibacterales bacterium]
MRAYTTPIALAFVLLLSVRVQAQSLEAAKELYASAEYESALAMLNELRSTDRPREEQQSIELYRVLCLVATGKETDARGAMEGLVTRNPMFRPTSDLPPRVRNTYAETRKKLLPAAVQAAYQEAKAAFDIKDFIGAERGFALVLQVLADPDMDVAASKSPLSDIRMLATGFHELSAKGAIPPEPVAPAPVPALVPAPAPSPVVQELPPPPPRVAKVYNASDGNVVPPLTLHQQIPPFRGQVREAQVGIIEVVVDTMGGVESAAMIASINPQYDRQALAAARLWQYQPARLDGVPVKYVKRIQVNLVPGNN